jgi:hypothetical protein
VCHWHLASAEAGGRLFPPWFFLEKSAGNDHPFPLFPDPELPSKKEIPKPCPPTLSAQSAKIFLEIGPALLLFCSSGGLSKVLSLDHPEKQRSGKAANPSF